MGLTPRAVPLESDSAHTSSHRPGLEGLSFKPSRGQFFRDHEPCDQEGEKNRQEYIEENLGNVRGAFCDPGKAEACGDHGDHEKYCRPL